MGRITAHPSRGRNPDTAFPLQLQRHSDADSPRRKLRRSEHQIKERANLQCGTHAPQTLTMAVGRNGDLAMFIAAAWRPSPL